MQEQAPTSGAERCISFLIKSLQIFFHSQAKFSEVVEVVGSISVQLDHKYKFTYVLDERMCKDEGYNTTSFWSSSYLSSPPSKQPRKTSSLEFSQDYLLSEISRIAFEKSEQEKGVEDSLLQPDNLCPEDNGVGGEGESQGPSFSVTVAESGRSGGQMVVKLEGDDNSTDCLMASASSCNYEQVTDVDTSFSHACRSVSFEESQGNQLDLTSKMTNDQDNSLAASCDVNAVSKDLQLHLCLPEPAVSKNSQHPFMESLQSLDIVTDMKQLIARLATLCDMTIVKDELFLAASKNLALPSDENIKAIKKNFLENFDKDKLKKMKDVLRNKKGRQKKQHLLLLLTECGLSQDQLLLLAQDTNMQIQKINFRNIAEGSRKEAVMKEQKKALRLKTQERQQKLLEMAEMLKRNQALDPGVTIISKTGGGKCLLSKSSVSVLSHSTQQLSLDNISEVAECLTGRSKKLSVQNACPDKSKDLIKLELSRRTCMKKKLRHVIAKMLDEVSSSGYRVLVTSTIGSETGSHSAELSVVPIRVDDFLPEAKESDVKPELSEEDYAKQLEREQILEKQQANEEKMKEMEIKLLRILTGAEEIFIPMRKRYSKGEPRPSDAERMKEYRKKLKQDPAQHQLYKQKHALNKTRRRLSELVAKVKVNTAGAAVAVMPTASVNEESHGSQTMGALVSMTQPVGAVAMHCPQVFESHQPNASVVNVHHTGQYVGQVAGMHQQPMAYGSDMDIVELIAATHSVQNQHYG